MAGLLEHSWYQVGYSSEEDHTSAPVVIPGHWLSPAGFVEVTPTRPLSSQDFGFAGQTGQSKKHVNIEDMWEEGKDNKARKYNEVQGHICAYLPKRQNSRAFKLEKISDPLTLSKYSGKLISFKNVKQNKTEAKFHTKLFM